MIFLNEDHTPLDAVIFDLGNVLLDYNPRRFMAELGIDVKYIDRLMEIFPHSQEWQDLDQNLISDDGAVPCTESFRHPFGEVESFLDHDFRVFAVGLCLFVLLHYIIAILCSTVLHFGIVVIEVLGRIIWTSPECCENFILT